uniref:Uncharacterized protein n=1 Tax=Arundo donax TaxID=35708 RepID=A0A0A8YWK4_ARUDO
MARKFSAIFCSVCSFYEG